MDFYADAIETGGYSFTDFSLFDFTSERELTQLCELTSAITDGLATILFAGKSTKIALKASFGNVSPEAVLPLLENLGSDENLFSDKAKAENSMPNEQVFKGCVWLKDGDQGTIGGLALFGAEEQILKVSQRNALSLTAENFVKSLRRNAVIQKNKSFEKIFNFSSNLICIVDFQGRFEKINPAFTSILGWSWGEIVDRPFASFIFPEDLAHTNEVFGNLVKGEVVENFVHRFITSDGKNKIIQWTSTPDMDSGRIYAIGRDVTEEKNLESKLRESKARLREFFENSQGLMCTHDMKGKFLTVNRSGAEMLGYTREDVLERTLFDLVPEEFHGGVSGYLERIRTQGKAEGQMYIKHRNGKIHTWLFNNVLQTPLDGEEAYVIGNAIDITNRAQLEKDLKQTKTLLEETGKVARVGGWELDLVSQTLLWTPMTRIIHEVAEDFVPNLVEGINFYKEGESRDRITKAVQEAIEEGVSWNLDLQIVTAKGNILWVRAIGHAIREEGVTKKLVGTFQDIDTEKRAELEAASAKKLLTDIIEASSEVSVIATDTEGIITVFNKGAERMLGYSAAEMIGKQTPQIIHLPEEIQKQSEEVSAEFGIPVTGFSVFVARAEKNGAEKRNWTYVAKDGQLRQVELVVTPIRDLDQITIGYLGIAIDITEKLETEIALNNERSRLTAFVKHTPAAVAMLDRELNYLAISNRWTQEFKIKEEDVIGQSHYVLFAEVITEESYVWHRKVLNGEIVGRQEEKVSIPGVEEPQYLSWEMRPWYLYDGEIGGMMILSQNVTGMVKRREELQQAKNQAEEASRAKSEFLANMSHEIRTPLNGVIGFTDLVLKTKLTDTQNQYLTIVNQSANSLLGIINDILDFSKIEAGKLELDIEKGDLYELASQATDIITYQIQQKGLELLLNIDSALPRFIHSDSVRLKQVLVNLLGNAAKFTEKGEIELKIHLLEAGERESKIRFSVRDTGIGIHPEKQAKIFEAFSQEDSSTTKKYGGTGLGLTISNKLLGLMDSKLQIQSKPGKGSTFFFDVSFTSEQGDPIHWVGLDDISHVLVVDDNENNRVIVSQMLRLKNIRTTEATNGFEALQLLANGKKYDVILMDYHMPYMDGIETIKKIRETFEGHLEDMPILLLHSSSDDQRIMQACKEFGIRFRLIKPLKIQELYHALAHLSEKMEVAESSLENPKLNTQKITILIAEDNPINMLLAETILLKCLPNVRLIKAENGKEALEFCLYETPDLIFMDVQMPEMNGYEATQSIRQLSSCINVPIVALTAGNVKGEKEKCLDAGMNDFVVKPVVEETIHQVLSKWIKWEDESDAIAEKVSAEIKLRHFDTKRLKVYANGNLEFYQKILLIVKSELSSSKSTLKDMLELKDLRGLKEVGHKLYGTAISSGFELLADYAKRLEIIESLDGTYLIELVGKIDQEIQYVLAKLDGE